MIDATTAGAMFGAMVVMAVAAWGFMGPLRSDAGEARDQPRSIVTGKGIEQRARARKIKVRYRNWALVATAASLVATVPIVLVMAEIRFTRPFVWQKAVLVVVWLGYLVGTFSLWRSHHAVETEL